MTQETASDTFGRRDGHGVREPRRSLRTLAREIDADVADHRRHGRWACFASGARARGHPAPLTLQDSATRRSCSCRCARRRRRRTGAARARDVRGRARLGDLLPHGVRRGPLGCAVGRRWCRPRSPAATARSTRCAWRRATRSGGRHRPRAHAVRVGPGLLREARQGVPSVATRWSRRRSPASRSAPPAWSSTTSRRWRRATSPCAGRRRARSRDDQRRYRLHVGSSIAFVYLPVEPCMMVRAWRWASSASGWGATVTKRPAVPPRSAEGARLDGFGPGEQVTVDFPRSRDAALRWQGRGARLVTPRRDGEQDPPGRETHARVMFVRRGEGRQEPPAPRPAPRRPRRRARPGSALGATRRHRPGRRPWVVLHDPEGNEFCLPAAPTPLNDASVRRLFIPSWHPRPIPGFCWAIAERDDLIERLPARCSSGRAGPIVSANAAAVRLLCRPEGGRAGVPRDGSRRWIRS